MMMDGVYRVYDKDNGGNWRVDHIECAWMYLPEWCKIDVSRGGEWIPYRDENGKRV